MLICVALATFEQRVGTLQASVMSKIIVNPLCQKQSNCDNITYLSLLVTGLCSVCVCVRNMVSARCGTMYMLGVILRMLTNSNWWIFFGRLSTLSYNQRNPFKISFQYTLTICVCSNMQASCESAQPICQYRQISKCNHCPCIPQSCIRCIKNVPWYIYCKQTYNACGIFLTSL